ncbi:MAG: Ldh family oxidoreductase [Planctomycetota bacterium]|jgi:LDH2 family malate/lactate/ureidoglycolate dehydrogenase|nr:Ldh family oxidoreductase [Planctomycetota bacterium]
MRCSEPALMDFCAGVMEKAGLPPEDAETFAASLVGSEMRGVPSHGITRLKAYFDRIRLGQVRPAAELSLVNGDQPGSTLLLDGNNGPGVTVAAKAMDRCLERAGEGGVCFAAVRNTSHAAAGWFYVQRAAARGMIGLSVCNTNPLTAPFGSGKPMLGTNPISIAIPADRHPGLLLDMATSAAARGKVDLYAKLGKPLPDGWIVDQYGRPSNNPADLLLGAMLPFGGVKGYGLALIIDIVASALSGAKNGRQITSFFNSPDPEGFKNIGLFMGALDVRKFLPLDLFKERVDGILDEFKRCPPAPGTAEVMIPGEIEHRNLLRARADGIDVPDNLLEELRSLAAIRSLPDPFARPGDA